MKKSLLVADGIAALSWRVASFASPAACIRRLAGGFAALGRQIEMRGFFIPLLADGCGALYRRRQRARGN